MFRSSSRIIAKKPQNSLNSSKSLLFNFTEKILPSAITKSLSRETKTSKMLLVDSLSPSKASSSIKTKRCSPDTNAQFVGPRIAGSCFHHVLLQQKLNYSLIFEKLRFVFHSQHFSFHEKGTTGNHCDINSWWDFFLICCPRVDPSSDSLKIPRPNPFSYNSIKQSSERKCPVKWNAANCIPKRPNSLIKM